MCVSQALCAAAGEVRLQRGDVVVIRGVVRSSSACLLELLSCVSELEGCIRVSRVWEKGTFPFENICHTL